VKRHVLSLIEGAKRKSEKHVTLSPPAPRFRRAGEVEVEISFPSPCSTLSRHAGLSKHTSFRSRTYPFRFTKIVHLRSERDDILFRVYKPACSFTSHATFTITPVHRVFSLKVQEAVFRPPKHESIFSSPFCDFVLSWRKKPSTDEALQPAACFSLRGDRLGT